MASRCSPCSLSFGCASTAGWLNVAAASPSYYRCLPGTRVLVVKDYTVRVENGSGRRVCVCVYVRACVCMCVYVYASVCVCVCLSRSGELPPRRGGRANVWARVRNGACHASPPTVVAVYCNFSANRESFYISPFSLFFPRTPRFFLLPFAPLFLSIPSRSPMTIPIRGEKRKWKKSCRWTVSCRMDLKDRSL